MSDISCLPLNERVTFYNRRLNSICCSHCLILGLFPKLQSVFWRAENHIIRSLSIKFSSSVILFINLLLGGFWPFPLSPLLTIFSPLRGSYFMILNGFITLCFLNIYINWSIYLLPIPHIVFKRIECFFLSTPIYWMFVCCCIHCTFRDWNVFVFFPVQKSKYQRNENQLQHSSQILWPTHTHFLGSRRSEDR